MSRQAKSHEHFEPGRPGAARSPASPRPALGEAGRSTELARRAATLSAVALCVLACSTQTAERNKRTQSSAAAPARKSKVIGFTAKIDGIELPLETALAFSRGGSAIQLTMSTHPLACKHLAGRGFKVEPNEVTFDLTLAPSLAADGTTPWHITGARLGSTSRQGQLAPASVGAFDPRGRVTTSFDAALHFPPSKLEVSGTINTLGCGILPWSDKAMVRPQKSLRLAIADKRIAINGASLARTKKGELRIHLTSLTKFPGWYGCRGCKGSGSA